MSENQISWLVAKAGGHGYSATLEIVHDAVMINMENCNHAALNADNSLTVGGAGFQDLTVAAAAGGRELRLHGLTSDAVRDIWDGTIIDVNADSHPDLFWGMCGAGQNFSIVI
ncbi:hypothetical protein FE257_007177 [Aspergillus nanangensis]|uniref:Uncharacterized protein n=1 Tax=Aspergillus nanangensis TaxID=2582783 RepID=A0AAD4CN98_ASPNN|nr:hypothetical protein FE257_007177 [Aspergillus nanangensis]